MSQVSVTEPLPLQRRQLLAYGLPYLAYAVVFQPMALYIPAFYADDLALPLAGVGMAIAASRALDLFTDPLIGMLGDRTRTRWGRRRPWVAIGALPMLLAIWMVFVPPAHVGLGYLLFWTCILFLAVTLVDLPYKSWGAELSTDYHQRSRITAWREALGFGGQLLAVGVLLGAHLFGYHTAREQLTIIALTVLIALPPFLSLALYTVPERPPEHLAGTTAFGWQGIKLLLANPAFVRIIGTVVLFCTGLTIQSTLHRLVLSHIVNRTDLFLVMLLLENLCTIAAVPLWKAMAYRSSKHRALALAVLWVGLWSLLLPLCDRPGTAWPLVVLLVIRGIPFASILFLANSIAADVVDYDTVASGRQRTGLFFALWTMMTKLSVALGILLGTLIPASFGIEPSQSDSFSEAAKFAMLGVYGWLPGILMAASAVCLWHFPMTRERQQQLRAQILARSTEARSDLMPEKPADLV
jgi:glycoside/pentoside/hexuronide:cation symporter, GPH family